MIKIKTVSAKNFLSVGNVTQALNFCTDPLTLVRGNNLDTAESAGLRSNASGKCLCINTIVKLRNTETGEIYEQTIGELYEQVRNKSQKVNDN